MAVAEISSSLKPRIDFSLYGGAESAGPLAPKSKSSGGPKINAPSARRTVVEAGEFPEGMIARKEEDPSDFLWLLTEEPHRSRRKQILKDHPEVTKLMGHEPLTKWIVLGVVVLQLAAAYLLRHTHPFSPVFLLTAYAIGGTANHNLFLAIHEITHNLAFKGIKANKLLAIFANLPIGIPYSVMFKRYHIEHHKYLGEDGIDTDLPSRLEMLCMNNVAGKAFFCTFQILFYALRPGFIRAQTLTPWHFLNFAVQLAFDFLLYLAAGPKAIIYLIMSSFFAGSLHPCAGHFIAEHYVWDGLNQETYSYYGPLNVLAYNVGYHNEHHDFPSVAWTRLPALKALAPEYYDTLPSHPSWPMVTFNFIFDKNVGMWSRVKRLPTGARTPDVGGLPPKGGQTPIVGTPMEEKQL
ncbi:dihydroceramide delta-4 desaturase [Dacryopinax primogenitus]|uniref:sphingolipid 4-desaturase n=1 Tax=Dacryopinax primogenitus (strain DJM 731) TaxID=1858805 RepID=M5G7F3_DACPD|nr:dihydroceramide delta-4 desaturase [Dacryopinax primogenitus]EJU06151.1 dihydroceramide delta-4 desaturase [Dacryopinax primogenitus]